MKKLISILCMLFIVQFSFGQLEKADIEWKEGKKYYVHFVQAGNTLYGICRLYNVTADEVLEANPVVSKGLQEGQKLLIPFNAGAKVQPSKPEKDKEKDKVKPVTTPPVTAPSTGKTHLVEKSETLYGISRKYEVSMEDMVKANPGIENGISVGQTLNIPVKSGSKPVTAADKPVYTPATPPQTKITFYDTTIVHTVLDHETLYSISRRFMVPAEELQQFNSLKSAKIKPGDVLKIPLKKETFTKVEVRKVEKVETRKVDEELMFSKKGEYKVVVLLPFNFEKGTDGITEIATEFLMGAQIALDSLARLGLRAEVSVLDCGSDSLKLKTMFTQREFKTADLVIGPFTGDNLDVVARWCKANKVRMVNPLVASTNILKDNAFTYNAVASDITLMEGAALHITQENAKDQVVLVKVGTKDNDLYQAFRQKFLAESLSGSKQKLIEIGETEMGTYIRKGGNTIFVVPTRDKVFALKFMNALNKVGGKAGNGTISVYGTREWVNFDEIKGYYKNKYNFHYASPNDFNYGYESTKWLMRQYRRKYNADLSKYSTQGFDVTFYFIQKLLLDKKPEEGVMNNIRLVSTGSGSGYENKTCYILQQVDYEIIKVAEVHE
jgi:LysM repeat protein